MSIIKNSVSFHPKKKTIVTVGTFDGVHRGHQKIIEQLVTKAQEKECEATLLTFDPHPRKVLQPDAPVALIQTLEERAKTLAKLGLTHLVVQPFTRAFSQYSAKKYVQEILVNLLNVEEIIIGHNHRFGKNRTADVSDLKRFGEQFGFSVTQIDAEALNNISISSTKIRTSLKEGDVATANAFLGHSFTLSGKVVEGKQKGRTIGFPTANIAVASVDKIIPKQGVYAVRVGIKNKAHLGMMNIGTNPTVNGHQTSIEVHVFDWSGDLYNQTLEVALLNRIRDEIKFDSLETLKNQLEKDKESIATAYKTLPL